MHRKGIKGNCRNNNKEWNMKIHEYQGKKIFSDYGMPVQDGYIFEKLENDE